MCVCVEDLEIQSIMKSANLEILFRFCIMPNRYCANGIHFALNLSSHKTSCLRCVASNFNLPKDNLKGLYFHIHIHCWSKHTHHFFIYVALIGSNVLVYVVVTWDQEKDARNLAKSQT